MPTTTHAGGCQCGAVRYTVTSTPQVVIACHCPTCRLRTGALYGVGVYFREEDVSFNGAEMGAFEFHSDTSGRWIRNEFCSRCATAVTWTLEMRPGMRAIAGGTFDDPQWFDIEAHIWTRSARKDMCYPRGMAVYEQALT